MRAADSKTALRATWVATRLGALISPRVAGPFAARLWFTPWRVPVGPRGLARQEEWLRPTESLAFDVDGRKLAGFTAGSGPAVLLVHGWGERAASLGAFVSPLVEAGYRVVGVDLPGHGASEGGRVDGFEIARAIGAVGESVGDLRAVVAHSMGALTTMYAVREGLHVDALVLLGPAARLANGLAKFGEMFSLPPNAVKGLKDWIDRRYGADVWDRISAQTITRDLLVPALIVHDRDDPQVDFADAAALHGAWPTSRLVSTESLGHGRILRDQDVVEGALAFLNEVAPARRVGAGA
ncbi:MAG TPA: alpha/beta fold hydrolase [Actinomycetota bacterium]|nr:alpha/beta fold hydrolase [Actinomycetota bacterium]